MVCPYNRLNQRATHPPLPDATSPKREDPAARAGWARSHAPHMIHDTDTVKDRSHRAPDSEEFPDETYRAECVCGWSIKRDKRASNLPPENNKEITRTVASLHETRPRFGDSADETHAVSFSDTDREVETA